MEPYAPPVGRTVIGIDPGTEQSALVVLEPDAAGPSFHDIVRNDDMILSLKAVQKALAVKYPAGPPVHVGVEMIASYGMPVGEEVFSTVLWTGHFITNFPKLAAPTYIRKVYRRNVKMHLCGNNSAKDSNVRRALIDRFPRSGGGKTPQIGTKGEPGPLYGLKKDEWAALGVAITTLETWDSLPGYDMISDPIPRVFNTNPPKHWP